MPRVGSEPMILLFEEADLTATETGPILQEPLWPCKTNPGRCGKKLPVALHLPGLIGQWLLTLCCLKAIYEYTRAT
jgi:hypothetical protein